MVHITGGGFYENIPRVLPKGVGVDIDVTAWPQLPIFGLLQKWGNVDAKEMYRTFNMGIGMIMIVDEKDADAVLRTWPTAMKRPMSSAKSSIPTYP